jgi:hypothetical protein
MIRDAACERDIRRIIAGSRSNQISPVWRLASPYYRLNLSFFDLTFKNQASDLLYYLR